MIVEDTVTMSDEERAALRDDFQAFVEMFYAVLDPASIDFDAPYTAYICASLQNCADGPERRLAVLAPPRHGKSSIISCLLPAWLIARNPKVRIICVSHDESLAEALHAKTRRVMESPLYRAFAPWVQIDRSTSDLIETSEGGFRMARPLGGNLTGHGGHWILMDDLINRANVMSDRQLEQCEELFHYLESRVDDFREARMILAMQRLRIGDPADVAEAKGWTMVTCPLVAPVDTVWEVPGRFFYRRRAGEVLDQTRMTREEAERFRAHYGRHRFLTEYQQERVLEGAGILDWSCVRFYDVAPSQGHVVQSWDVAVTLGAGNHSVGTTWLYADGLHYLLDVERRQFNPTLLESWIKRQAERLQADCVLVEAASVGISTIDHLITIHGMQNVIAIPVKGSKQDRMLGVMPLFERGEVLFPREASWLNDVRSEFSAFPVGRTDDIVDSISQYLNHYRRVFELRGIPTAESHHRRLVHRLATISADGTITKSPPGVGPSHRDPYERGVNLREVLGLPGSSRRS